MVFSTKMSELYGKKDTFNHCSKWICLCVSFGSLKADADRGGNAPTLIYHTHDLLLSERCWSAALLLSNTQISHTFKIRLSCYSPFVSHPSFLSLEIWDCLTLFYVFLLVSQIITQQ